MRYIRKGKKDDLSRRELGAEQCLVLGGTLPKFLQRFLLILRIKVNLELIQPRPYLADLLLYRSSFTLVVAERFENDDLRNVHLKRTALN